jgi:hypothetical protein
MFDNAVEIGWSQMSASTLAQWGPPVTRALLGATPSLHAIRELIITLRNHDNEFDIQRLLGLMKVVTS